MLFHEGHVRAMRFFTSSNSSSYDWVVRLATFGQDYAWKHEIIKAVGNHSYILELACGTGILSSMLARRDKNVAGIDLTFEYLRVSRHKLNSAIVSSYLAKYVDIQEVIDECWRVLRPGGIVVFHDFTYPHGFMSGLWNRYFALLRLAGRFVASWKVVFGQLDDVIKNSDWVDRIANILENRKFQNVHCRWYTAGTAAIVSAEKP
jgi:demethylmenaquinone methyltransferase/2-methoxy-6-polyprenyl-1,4-benzoquinol methylase